jgi:hypothetical protein
MATAERLVDYYAFSPDVVDTVSEFAKRQSQYVTYQGFFHAMGIEGTQKLQSDGYLPVDVLDIRPKDYDPTTALIYHLPMANPLDPNQIYQLATVAATNPDRRIIATGNPSGPGYNSGLLTAKQRNDAAHGKFQAVVEPVLRFAEQQGITTVDEIGDSYGVDTAATAAAAGRYEVGKLICIEPASVKKRNLAKLALDFNSTAKPLGMYVAASNLPTFNEARKDSVSAAGYAMGLGRLTNLAIGRGLARGRFVAEMDDAFEHQKTMESTIIWGSESELAIDALMTNIVGGLQEQYGERVKAIRLPGQKHNLANDIHLQAALVLQSLRAA